MFMGVCKQRQPSLYPVFHNTEGGGCVSIFYAWASALLVQTVMGNARALVRGTSNRYDNPRFFIKCTNRNSTIFNFSMSRGCCVEQKLCIIT